MNIKYFKLFRFCSHTFLSSILSTNTSRHRVGGENFQTIWMNDVWSWVYTAMADRTSCWPHDTATATALAFISLPLSHPLSLPLSLSPSLSPTLPLPLSLSHSLSPSLFWLRIWCKQSGCISGPHTAIAPGHYYD